MKILDLRDDDDFVGIQDIAEKVDCDERKVLETFKAYDVIHVLAFDLQLYESNSGLEERVYINPVQPNDTDMPTRCISRYILLAESSIARMISQGEIDCKYITENNYFWGVEKGRGEGFVIKKKDLFIKKKDVVRIADDIGILMEPVEFPLELTIALECYKDLYKDGIPDPLNRKNEKKNIYDWLRDNYTFLDDNNNRNIRDRIAMMINPVPFGENENIPQRK